MVKLFHLIEPLIIDSAGVTAVNPGVAYVEAGPTRYRTRIDFSKFDSVSMRVVITAQGNEVNDPVTKGIEVYDVTGAAQLCEVEWLGNGLQEAVAGSWTLQNAMTVDSILTIRVKGSSGTEDITVLRVELQIRYH